MIRFILAALISAVLVYVAQATGLVPANLVGWTVIAGVSALVAVFAIKKSALWTLVCGVIVALGGTIVSLLSHSLGALTFVVGLGIFAAGLAAFVPHGNSRQA